MKKMQKCLNLNEENAGVLKLIYEENAGVLKLILVDMMDV